MNWTIFFIIVIAFIVITFTFAYIIFNKVSVRKKPRKTDIKSLFSQNKLDLVGEETIKNTLEWIENSITDHVYIHTEDNLKLEHSCSSVRWGTHRPPRRPRRSRLRPLMGWWGPT